MAQVEQAFYALLFRADSALHGVLERNDALRNADATLVAWTTKVLGEQHPMSQQLPLVSPSLFLFFFTFYIVFVALLCPLLALVRGDKNKPVTVRITGTKRVYNAFMVALSFYMGTKTLVLAAQGFDSVWCVPMTDGEHGKAMAWMAWIFTYSKVLEFFDSISMAIEGRWRQLSFLHTYHHVSIWIYWYAILWLAPGSDGYFSLALNSYIHVVMYLYYFLTSFEAVQNGPNYKFISSMREWLNKYKFYVTKMQIAQFCSFVGQSIYVGYYRTGCDFPDGLSKGLLWYMISLITLFLNFMFMSGRKGGKAKGAKKVE
ncbi:Elongation of very long chain fatty acids protein 2 [Porphyridium purpureum]|uniref:Elongation of fatty acids protein n=1 Tax=Porphyridium purpureum TaxID=35688 RepID=A0A5J4Z949_PORPP|nr:Elongation of very long chain fatty acids protein 2 [Porphyridium purpureum]|eukprot:POR6911..scf295_1